MSQDDLVRELSVMDKHEISPTTSTGLLSPSVCDSPKHQASDEEVEDEEEDMNGKWQNLTQAPQCTHPS